MAEKTGISLAATSAVAAPVGTMFAETAAMRKGGEKKKRRRGRRRKRMVIGKREGRGCGYHCYYGKPERGRY